MEEILDSCARSGRTVGHSRQGCGQSEAECRIAKVSAREKAPDDAMKGKADVRAPERLSYGGTEVRAPEACEDTLSARLREDGVQGDECLPLRRREPRKFLRHLDCMCPRALRVEHHEVHAIIEVVLRNLRGLYVLRSLDAGDETLQVASLPGHHGDERACKASGVREDDSIVSRD